VHDQALGRPFWTLWSAFTASNLADGLSLVTLPLLAITLTDDVRLIAAVAVFQYLPFLVLGLPAGLVIDQYDRRWIAVVAQLLRAAVVGGLGVALLAGEVSIQLLLVVAFLIGASEVMTDGGLPALVRELVPSDRLEVANARLSATQTVSNAFVGPPLGALLFGAHAAIPFLLSAVVSLTSALTLGRLPGRYRAVQTTEVTSLRHRLVVGLRYVWAHPVLRPLVMAVGTFSFVGAAGNAVFVVLITERFGIDGVGFGVLISVDAIASVIMSFFVARLIRRSSHSWSMRLSIVCFVVGALLLGFSTVAAFAFVAASINGVSGPTWNIVSSTVRQRLVPDEVFGRMMTAYLFIAWGLRPVGAMAGGFVAEAWGAHWVSIGSAIVVGSLLVSARPMFRRVDRAMADSISGRVPEGCAETAAT
jgi:MFS family permease